MPVTKEYREREFLESKYFQPKERRIAGLSRNNLWLYTVEQGNEIERDTSKPSEMEVIRIVRWQAKNGDKKEEKYWSYRKSYNIRSTREWAITSNIVDSLFKGGNQTDSFIPISAEEYERLYAESRKRKSDNRKLSSIIRSLKTTYEVEREVFEQKLSLMRSKMNELDSVLRAYKSLIAKTGTTETEVHEFIVKHNAFWMFGLEYICIKSKVRFPPGEKHYEFDLMLQRYDSFWDLVEFKGPNENLFDKRTSKRSKPNQKLSEAIGQVFAYLYAIDKTWDKNVVKPKAYIVIGKNKTDRADERRLFSSYLNNVELITHSDLYQRGRLLLDRIKE